MADLRKTPLNAVHRESGARMVDFGGWDMPVEYSGTIAELKPTLVKFREAWKDAVENVSEMHQKAAARTIASYEADLARAKAAREAREREDARLRALFREKNP